MVILSEIADVLDPVFNGVPWCIAGGAVRDTMLGLQPKDYDVFVLGYHKEAVAKMCKSLNIASDWDLPAVHPSSKSDLVDDYMVLGNTVQVMAMPYTFTPENLISNFDWNICQFATQGGKLISVGDLPKAGDTLKLVSSKFPASTLERGYRFAKRFDMVFPEETETMLKQLVAHNVEKWGVLDV